MRTTIRSIMGALMLLACIGVCSPIYAAGVVVHVSLDGDDGNDGAIDKPLASLEKAVELASYRTEPAEIIIHGGVYRVGDIEIGKREDRYKENLPTLVIRAAENEEVIIDGSGTIEGISAVAGKENVWKFKYSYASMYPQARLWEEDTRTRYQLVADVTAVERFPATFSVDGEYLYLHTSDGHAPEEHKIGITKHHYGFTVWRGNTVIKGIGFRNFLTWRMSGGVQICASDTRVEDCWAWNCAWGIVIRRTYKTSQKKVSYLPERTKITNCRVDDCGGGVFSHGIQAQIKGGRFLKIRDAFMVKAHQQDDTGILCYYPARGAQIFHNLVVGFNNSIFYKSWADAVVIEHNTCVNSIRYGIGCTSYDPAKPVIFRHNIITGCNTPFAGNQKKKFRDNSIIDYNCFWNLSPGAKKALKKDMNFMRQVGTGSHNITANPLFAAVSAGDYRLFPSSPCARIGEAGEVCGAFGLVEADFENTRQPMLEINASSPARQAEKTVVSRRIERILELKSPPIAYCSARGAVILFETNIPCTVTAKCGADTSYGMACKRTPEERRISLPYTGGTSIGAFPGVVLLPPMVEKGKTYHYQLVLEDKSGGKIVTEDATFTLAGGPRTIYVSPAGEDIEGRGTRQKPWRMLQFAVDRSLPGDSVLLLPGLYTGQTNITRGGIKDAPIVIRAEKPGTVIFDGRHAVRSCLSLHKAPHIVVRDIEVRWYKRTGIYIAHSPRVSIRNCKIWNDYWSNRIEGIGIFATRSPHLVIDHNLIFSTAIAMQIIMNPSVLITHNTVTKTSSYGIEIHYSMRDSVVKNNCFVYNGNSTYEFGWGNPNDLGAFTADYNNLAGILRFPEPGDTLLKPTERIFQVTSTKRVVRTNSEKHYNFRKWQLESSKEQHSIFADPLFVNPEKQDFRLLPGSPNIGAGENGATIGAFGVAESR